MSVKLIVEFKGKRQAISIAPMAPLQKVIDAFCFQQKPQLDVSGCQLSFQKQVLDPTIPVRFANLPKEAKLELIADTAQPKQRLGLTDRPAPSSPPQMAPVHDITSATEPDAPASVSELPSAQPASPSSMYQPMDTEPPHIQLQSGTDFLQPHANATVATAAADDAASQQASTTQAAAGSQSQGADVEASHKDNSTKATSAASFSGDDRPPPLGFDRQIHVFTREAIAAAEASTRSDTELPPEFYDFTPDDYHKVMSGWAKQNSKAAGPLKTQKLREQDERRRAEQFGPIPVRVHFPDGHIVQADFRALETLASLQKLVQLCMLPSLHQWYMYVTPPKQAFKDLSLTFYKAGLLPAANILLGMDSKHDGPFLKPEIVALCVLRLSDMSLTNQTVQKPQEGPKAIWGLVPSFCPAAKQLARKKFPNG